MHRQPRPTKADKGQQRPHKLRGLLPEEDSKLTKKHKGAVAASIHPIYRQGRERTEAADRDAPRDEEALTSIGDQVPAQGRGIGLIKHDSLVIKAV